MTDMPMLTTRRLFMALAASLLAAPAAAHHPGNNLDEVMGSREKYFQPIDKPAPPFSLQDSDGRKFSLADFEGKVVVLHFVYASCGDVCPLHADRIAEIQDMVNVSPSKEQVQFITITTDPEKDTPQILRDYGPAHGLDGANWTFLTTTPGQPEDTTRRLAEAFGHTFTQTPSGAQVHGVVTHVIDKQGLWRANFHGLRFQSINLVLYVNSLVNEGQRAVGSEAKSLWDRLRGFF
jgi:protein SCO1/2